MEISGQRLSIPRNFFFLNRLPARFEILVVGKGAQMPKGTAFELEILGQRLVLQSKIDLKVGARYELEKISAMEFKILAEKNEESRERPATETRSEAARKSETIQAETFFRGDGAFPPADLLALKVLADSGRSVSRENGKYLFNLATEFDTSGVFVPASPGRYRLFVSGQKLAKNDIDNLAALLAPLGVESIRHVNAGVLARLAAGAVDISS